MFDHEKMSEKDQNRYAEAMQASIDEAKALEAQELAWPANCGAPLDPEQVKAGKTWCSDQRKWVTHQELGATVTKLHKGWEEQFGREERYAYHKGLKVVRLAYDPWVYLDENKGDN